MKKFLKKAFSSVLVLLMIFSSMSFVAQNKAFSATTLSCPNYTVNGITVNEDSVGYQGPGGCVKYAKALYKIIWGVEYTNNHVGDSTTGLNMLRELSGEERKNTAENAKKFISQAALGAVIRINPTSTTANKDGSSGHTLIIVEKNENGFTALEHWSSNQTGGVTQRYTWAEFASTSGNYSYYGYFKYIKWPNAPVYTEEHTHNYTTYVAGGAATCETQGYTTKSCSCGQTITTYSPEKGHDFSIFSHYEESHPHYKVYRCSRCSKTQKTNETSFGTSCVQCNPSAFCANLGDDFYGVILNTACWKPISKTDGTNNISLQTENGSSMQKWRFQRQSDGAYVITSCYDGTTLEMTDGITTNDTQLSAKDGYWGGNYQQWYLIPQSDGLIFLSKHYPGEQWVMDLFENDTLDGNSITIQPRNNTDAQIWNVYAQDEIQLQSAKVTATVDQDTVTFTWPHSYGASSYSLKIWTGGEGWNGQGELYLNAENVKSGYSIDLPAGTYYAYVDSQDYYSFIMSNVVAINISERIPEKPVITSVTSNDEGMVTVEWTECERANSYSLRFYKSGEHYESLIGVAKDTVYWYELPSGTYTVKVTAEGDGYWKDSEMSDEFTVVCENKTPDSEFTCSECGATFENQVSLDEHLASCNVDGLSGGGGFFSMLINFFYFIIALLILPFKLIF